MFNWLENIVDIIVYNRLNLQPDTKIASVLHFFIYDTVKIFILLSFMIFAISYLRSYFQNEKIRRLLTGKKGIWSNILASLLGVISPFCSCSTVPVFIGFLEAGIPLGTTFSFLITSPLINEAALAILIAAFGIKLGLLYTFFGILIGVVGGRIIGFLKMEKYVHEFVYKAKIGEVSDEKMTQRQRFFFAKSETIGIVKKIGIFVILGITIGAFFHGWIPENALLKYAGKDNIFSVFIAVLFGVPMYSSAMATIPVIEALIGKGMAIGTALAFMMAITALSFPEMIILKKVIKMKLLAIFVLIVFISILFVGYLFNFVIDFI